MEFTDQVKLKATLALNTGESKTVALLGETQFELTFTLSGSKTALVQFRQDLTAKGSVLNYDVSQEYSPDDDLIPAEKKKKKAAGLTQRGITIKDISPQAIPIHLDRLIPKRDIPVELDAQGATFRLKGETPTVDVWVPESRWNRIRERLKSQSLRLRTKPVDLKELSTEEPIVAEVNAFLEGESVIVSEKTVTFDVEILSSRVTEEMVVTIRLLTPTAWAENENATWQNYVFVPNPASDWRPKLKIEGEPKNLKPENVSAYLELTDDDKKGTDAWLTRDVVVSFPPESQLRLAGPAPKVQFRLEKRKTPVAAPTIP